MKCICVDMDSNSLFIFCCRFPAVWRDIVYFSPRHIFTHPFLNFRHRTITLYSVTLGYFWHWNYMEMLSMYKIKLTSNNSTKEAINFSAAELFVAQMGKVSPWSGRTTPRLRAAEPLNNNMGSVLCSCTKHWWQITDHQSAVNVYRHAFQWTDLSVMPIHTANISLLILVWKWSR